MQFRIETFLNQNLSPNAARADAVFSVGADAAAAQAPVRRLVGLIADRSGSMSDDMIASLILALRIAIDQMDAEVEAFVVAVAAKPTLICRAPAWVRRAAAPRTPPSNAWKQAVAR